MKRANSIDDLEMRPDVQGKSSKVVERSGYRKFIEISDLEGYRKDFTICLVLQ
jgi:trans-2-enoyl-CoA reductase